MTALLALAQHFAETASSFSPLGNGLINDTFLVSTDTTPFVLQRINRQIFPKPELISTNLAALNQHLSQKAGCTSKLQLPTLINTLSGEPFYVDSLGDFWRALSFIADSESLAAPRHLDDSRQTGSALGTFHLLFSDLSVHTLHDTLPGFHIAPDYLRHYRQVAAQTHVKADNDCHQFINQFAALTDDLEHAKQQGLLTLRVIHGDPKLDNFLFSKHSQQVISLIDLDTVKPGLVHYDIGDGLRSCCHITETDQFDSDVCAAWLGAYLEEASTFFSEADFRYLYPAIRLIPFELGLRFYSDYLDGNRYFKTSFPEENLHRARAQFRLCADIMAKESTIKALLKHLHGRG
jgi:Ser/Thr protein kinase RdoA (MazF antagonist)